MNRQRQYNYTPDARQLWNYARNQTDPYTPGPPKNPWSGTGGTSTPPYNPNPGPPIKWDNARGGDGPPWQPSPDWTGTDTSPIVWSNTKPPIKNPFTSYNTQNPGTNPPPPTWRWHNIVNAAATPISWQPDWWQNPGDGGRKAAAERFRASLADPNDPQAAQSMNELRQFYANLLMGAMDPRAAARTRQELAVSGAPQFGQAYGGDEEAGINPVYDRSYAELDRWYNQKGRWDTIMQMLEQGNQQLLGEGDMSGFENDATTDPYESLQNWMRQAVQVGRQYGLEGDRTRRNRFEEEQMQTEMADVLSLAPDEAMANYFMRLMAPTRYTVAASPMQFRMGGGTQPQTAGGWNAQYAYRNPGMT